MDKKDREKLQLHDDRYQNLLKERQKSKLNKRDFFIMAAFVLFYFMINMLNLGSTFAPDNYWEVHSSARTGPDYVVVAPSSSAEVASIYIYKSIDEINSSSNSIKVYSAPAEYGDYDYTAAIKAANLRGTIGAGNNHTRLFKWYSITPKEISKDHVLIFACSDAGVRIMEIVLADEQGNAIECAVVASSRQDTHSPAAAFDEQHTFLGYKSLMSDSYFDEIYHARTAYEHIQGFKPYEVTHPPLGKILIGLGIRAFGMNPFGWRIVVVIFSTLCLPIAYMLGKLLFRNYKAAALMALFFALDGLHFVLGRIATLDAIAMFFSLSSVLLMTHFFKSNILRDKAYICFLPLAGAGVMFGFAVAVKWTGFYTGAGLLVMLLVYFARMFNEARYKLAEIYYNSKQTHKAYSDYSKNFNKKLLGIILTCVVFFLLIPFVTYLLSYIPYLYNANAALNVAGEQRSLWQVMWDNQGSMLWYHSDYVLGADTHPAQSRWWQWLYNGHSVFFYKADASFGEGMYARIHALGNPALAYGGLVALAICLYLALKPLTIYIVNRYRFVIAQEKHYKKRKNANTKNAAKIADTESLTDTESTIKKEQILAYEEANADISFDNAKACNLSFDAKESVQAQDSLQYNKITAKHRLSGSDKDALFVLLLGYFSALVPWMFVQRSTFIYHYTPAMPFLCGLIVFAAVYLYKRFPHKMRIRIGKLHGEISKVLFAVIIFTAFCAVMFVMLFPLYTGIPLSVELANIMFRWLNFFGTHYGI